MYGLRPVGPGAGRCSDATACGPPQPATQAEVYDPVQTGPAKGQIEARRLHHVDLGVNRRDFHEGDGLDAYQTRVNV